MNPETREHIIERHCDNDGRFDCGCHYRTDHTIWMCPFHTGYDEGIDRFRPAAPCPTCDGERRKLLSYGWIPEAAADMAAVGCPDCIDGKPKVELTYTCQEEHEDDLWNWDPTDDLR